MLQKQIQGWAELYTKDSEMFYPAEYVVRMFKGNYPRLNLKMEMGGYKGKSICDIGCGDGRHLMMFQSLGFERIAGTEISQDIVDALKTRLKTQCDSSFDLRVGLNNNLGFEDEAFDCLLSWNVCYYLDDKMDFKTHVAEYARVLKKDGILVFSIPCKDCFVYKDGIEKDGFMTIVDDWFGLRNGSVQKIFQDEEDIKNTFGTHFKDFTFGRIDDDCFGLPYKWFIGYCKKR